MKHAFAKLGLALGGLLIAGSSQATSIQTHGAQFRVINEGEAYCPRYLAEGMRNTCTNGSRGIPYILGMAQSLENTTYDVYVDGKNNDNSAWATLTFCAYDYHGNKRRCETTNQTGRGDWTGHVQFSAAEAYNGYISIQAELFSDVMVYGAGVYHW